MLYNSTKPQQKNIHDTQNVIRQIQADLNSYLIHVVNIRIATRYPIEGIGGAEIVRPGDYTLQK
jgi:hypothetical protein